MEYVVETNTVEDLFFKNTLYEKYISDIKSSSKYQSLENMVRKTEFQILFSYCKDCRKRVVQYEVGFEICDNGGKLLSVPTSSPFWDELNNLLSFFVVAVYKKRTKEWILSEIDQNELAEDCDLFMEYLKDINQSEGQRNTSKQQMLKESLFNDLDE